MGDSAFHVDKSRWPLVVVRWQGESTLEDANALADIYRRWLERQVRFGLVHDAGNPLASRLLCGGA